MKERPPTQKKRETLPTNRSWLIGLAVAMLALAPTLVLAQPAAVGRVKVVSGSVSIVRGGGEMNVKAGDAVFKSDILKTGGDGRLGITLKDDTRLSLGPSSEARVENFVYQPAEGSLALSLKIVRGVVAYVSGRIARLAPDAVRLDAPTAIVGVRGTTLIIKIEAERTEE
jgi:hypothetical protein